MATAAEHLALYDTLRATILARHMAIGRYHRANLLSLTNHLAPLPTDLQQLPAADREVLRRWNVWDHERENPLMVGGQLQLVLAVEHSLGSPSARHILERNLEAVASLVPTTGPTAGWITRWDAATTDRWQLDDQGRPVRCDDFLVDDAGRYVTCVPSTDHRHVALRARDTLLALRTRADADAVYDEKGNGTHWAYIDRRRRWEASMDELVGLFAGWAVSDRLVPAVRPLVRPPALAVAARLAGNGWTQIRPCGGFAARGSTGVLPSFEAPVDRWVRTIGGPGATSAVDFEGALRRAGYWTMLDGPVVGYEAALIAGAVVLAPLLAAIGPLGAAIDALLAGVAAAVGPRTLALVAALAANADCFDAWRPAETGEPALGALLASLAPPDRLDAFFGFVSMTQGWARNFPPFLALIGLGDAGSPVTGRYLSLIRGRRGGGAPVSLDAYGLDSAMSTAVAVALGAGELAPILVAQLDARHDDLVAAGRDARIAPGDGEETQGILPVMDYLAALSLAWLHASTTPGAPAQLAPPSRAALRGLQPPSVPAVVMEHLPEVRRVVLGGAPYAGGDVPLFSGPADRPKDVVTRAQSLPQRPSGAPWEFTYDVPRWMRDVPTGVVLQDGHEFEIVATGTVDGLGPEGGDPCDDPRWPLHQGLDPSARQGALLAFIGGYVRVGARVARRRNRTWSDLPLFFRIDRPAADRGSREAFQVTLRLWGTPPAGSPPGSVVECVRHETIAGRRAITGIGGTHADGRHWFVDAQEAIILVRDYWHRFRVRSATGPRVVVVGRRRPYLRSVGDRSRTNNLGSLPECPT